MILQVIASWLPLVWPMSTSLSSSLFMCLSHCHKYLQNVEWNRNVYSKAICKLWQQFWLKTRIYLFHDYEGEFNSKRVVMKCDIMLRTSQKKFHLSVMSCFSFVVSWVHAISVPIMLRVASMTPEQPYYFPVCPHWIPEGMVQLMHTIIESVKTMFIKYDSTELLCRI